MKTLTRTPSVFASAITAMAAAVVLSGCAKPYPDDTDSPIKKGKPFVANVPAGAPIGYSTKSMITEAKAKVFLARSDPFALTSDQMAFEKSQAKERILAEMGGDFYPVVPPPDTEEVTPVIEPQPYRRLAGVVVGQSVIGIIELPGDNQELIRPGQLVPGTEWRVVSIDTDRAVLRRGGNVLPHEISVRLESRPFGGGGGSPNTQGGGSGRPGGLPGVPGGGPTGPSGGGD